MPPKRRYSFDYALTTTRASSEAQVDLLVLRDRIRAELAEERARSAALWSENPDPRWAEYPGVPYDFAKWMDPRYCAQVCVEYLEHDLEHVEALLARRDGDYTASRPERQK